MKKKSLLLLFTSVFALSACQFNFDKVFGFLNKGDAVESEKNSEKPVENENNTEENETKKDGAVSTNTVSKESMIDTVEKNNKTFDLVKSFGLEKYENENNRSSRNKLSKNEGEEGTDLFVVTENYDSDYNELLIVHRFEDFLNSRVSKISDYIISQLNGSITEPNNTLTYGSFTINESNKTYNYATFIIEENYESIYEDVLYFQYGDGYFYYLVSDDMIEIYEKHPEQYVKEGWVDEEVRPTYFDRYLSIKYKNNEIEEVKGTLYWYEYNSDLKDLVTIRKENDVVTYVDYCLFCDDPNHKGGIDALTITTFKDDLCYSTCFEHNENVYYAGDFFEDIHRDFSSIEIIPATGGDALRIFPGRERLLIPVNFVKNYESMSFNNHWYENQYHVFWCGYFASGVTVDGQYYDYSEIIEDIDSLVKNLTFYPTTTAYNDYLNNDFVYPGRLAFAEFYPERYEPYLDTTFDRVLFDAAEDMGIELQLDESLLNAIENISIRDTRNLETIEKVSSKNDIQNWLNNSVAENNNPEHQLTDVMKLALEEVFQ